MGRAGPAHICLLQLIALPHFNHFPEKKQVVEMYTAMHFAAELGQGHRRVLSRVETSVRHFARQVLYIEQDNANNKGKVEQLN